MSDCEHSPCCCEESYYEIDERIGKLEDRVDDWLEELEVIDLKYEVRKLRRENKFILKLLSKLIKHTDLDLTKDFQ